MDLTLSLLITFANSLHPSRLTFKECFETFYFEKVNMRQQKHEKVPCLQRVNSSSYTSLNGGISVVPRARHCGIPAISPLMSLKNAPSAGLRAHLENLLIFSLFIIISGLSVT